MATDDNKKGAAERSAALAVSQTRSRLLLSNDVATTFFSSLAMRLRVEPDWGIPTACVDGVSLRYNPDFINGLNHHELRGLVVHEVLHLALLHHTRIGHRAHKKFNAAADLSVNAIVVDAGLVLPDGALFAGKPPFQNLPLGLSAEEYYELIPNGEDDSPSMGDVEAPGDGGPSDLSDSEGEWKVAVSQAETAAKMRGTIPAGLGRLIKGTIEPKKNYREILREFLSSHAKNDYSWRRPNRRFVHQDIYLPSRYSEELGDVAVAIDTSGSIGEGQLSVFAAELEAILGAYQCKGHIIYFDTKVYNYHTWEASDGPLVLNPKGGGGTCFKGVFKWVEEAESPPVCLVVLTDLHGSFPTRVPEVPTLWVVYGNASPAAPFGRVIQLED